MQLTLVSGGSAAAREAAIAKALDPDIPTAVILEGLASGASPLDAPPDKLNVQRIAPGCMCCVGNLTLRVTLNRLLRPSNQQPLQRLFIGIANDAHLAQIQAFLSSPPYDQLLELTAPLKCAA